MNFYFYLLNPNLPKCLNNSDYNSLNLASYDLLNGIGSIIKLMENFSRKGEEIMFVILFVTFLSHIFSCFFFFFLIGLFVHLFPVSILILPTLFILFLESLLFWVYLFNNWLSSLIFLLLNPSAIPHLD